MTKKEAINLMTQAYRDMEEAKEDFKAVMRSTIETYSKEVEGDITKNDIKAMQKIAQATAKSDLPGVHDEAQTILNTIEELEIYR